MNLNARKKLSYQRELKRLKQKLPFYLNPKTLEEAKEIIIDQKKENNRWRFNSHQYLSKLIKTKKSLRLQKKRYKKVKKDIGKDIFYSTHVLDDENPTHSFIDIYFLSKKYKNTYYSATIYSKGDEIVEKVDMKYFERFIYEHNPLNDLLTLKEDCWKEEQSAWNEQVNFQVDYCEDTLEDIKGYKYLTFYINNGKGHFSLTKKQIEQLIIDFWDNDEKPFVSTEKHNYLNASLYSVTKTAVNKLLNKKVSQIQEALMQKYLEEGKMTKHEVEVLTTKTKNVFSQSSKEDMDFLKVHGEAYKKFNSFEEVKKINEQANIYRLINGHLNAKNQDFINYVLALCPFKEENGNNINDILMVLHENVEKHFKDVEDIEKLEVSLEEQQALWKLYEHRGAEAIK